VTAIPIMPDPEAVPPLTVYTRTHIAAPPGVVWGALVDFETYAEWNSFTSAIEGGSPVVGADLMLTVHMKAGDAGRAQPERVVHVEAPRAVAWTETGLPDWLLRATRWQVLEAAADGGTVYHSLEVFRGPLAWWLEWSGILGQVQEGFERQSAGLKQYAEAAMGG